MMHASYTNVHSLALICTHLPSLALICKHLLSLALICTHLHSPATRKSWCPLCSDESKLPHRGVKVICQYSSALPDLFPWDFCILQRITRVLLIRGPLCTIRH